MTLYGHKRREHLRETREHLRDCLRDILVEAAAGLSYSEVYGEALAALEEIARAPAEIIKQRAEFCREEYCKPRGRSYKNIQPILAALDGATP